MKLLLLAGLLLSLGCKQEAPISPVIDSPAGSLPLLRGSNKIGTIIGFNPSHPDATTDSITARWQEALDAGMSIGRLQIDWVELEPQPNVYDTAALRDRLLDYEAQQLQTFLLISAYDSEGPFVPSDLQGLPFDDAVLINRFKRLMDWVIPMLVAHDGYLISITNEADNHFHEEPDLSQEIVTFIQEVKAHVHAIHAEMAVTVTLAEGSLDDGRPGIPEILQACDVACWNFYGSQATGSAPYAAVQSAAQVRADIRRMLDISGQKNIVIQELGMYAGNTLLSSSEETQRQFFEVFFQEMQQADRIRVAYNFQLVDWSPDVIELYISAFEGADIPQDFIDSFAESLETIGLIHYETGQRKPAWNEVIRWMREI